MGAIQRLNEFVEQKGISKYNFYKKTGLSNGFLDKGENVGTDKCEKIIYAFPDISPTWLITGNGSMFREEAALPEVNHKQRGAPYYNVDFIGGFDMIFSDQTVVPDYYINFEPYNKPGVIWCNITGHSMEPELSNGDFIAMKEMKSPLEYLPMGEIYGIVTDEYRTVKRVRRSDKKGFISLIPTNKNPEYCIQDIPMSMIRKVFAILGSVHRLF